MSFLDKTFDDAKKMNDEDLLVFVQTCIDKCEKDLENLQDNNNIREKTRLEISALRYNLVCVLETIKEIIKDSEFCHNESFSYRYQVPNFELIGELNKKIERNRSYVYSKLKNCIT